MKKNHTNDILKIYKVLLKTYGPQGWWPIVNKKTLVCEYHVRAPKNIGDVFEICLGAILTQNTNWSNVVKALQNLKKLDLLSPDNIRSCDDKILKQAIIPAGYYNQKTRKIKEFTTFFKDFIEKEKNKTPSRKSLLEIWGIGPETADSMLLYAFNVPVFVVDTYTKRILTALDIISENENYETIRLLFESSLPKDVKIYQEFHALIVQHGKIHGKKPSLIAAFKYKKV